MDGVRNTFKAICKTLMILVTAVLAIGSAAAFWYSTPANQLALIGGIGAILTLMAGLSINKLEWQDEQADTLRSIVDDMRSVVQVRHHFAQPEVHRLDLGLLAETKEMDRRGEPIDAICRRIDPGHDSHDEMHREAFRRMVRAMLDEG